MVGQWKVWDLTEGYGASEIVLFSYPHFASVKIWKCIFSSNLYKIPFMKLTLWLLAAHGTFISWFSFFIFAFVNLSYKVEVSSG